ncbi:hypothetical protein YASMINEVIRUS_895 [Yasminevirus sp. GU-2018]|uniref:Uncharacterized protein n=1 Tax=Yasminevirus sp. GU-2018 TaxID=2420051 RepID=A0A5K0UAA8_9VIRU|nr:hypothetical protein YASMINEVIRUS_895 [Yasminevirus sp. GU-2018]
MSTPKYQILEPITAVARLITLAFKPKNTKVAIRDHNVVLCEPKSDSSYWIKIPQGVDRYWNGDSREDIYILNHVLCNFIEWYIIPYKEKNQEIYKGLINMAKYLRVGLKELQSTYKTGNAVGTIQYYIIILTAVIEGWFYPDMLYNPAPTERRSFLDEDGIGGDGGSVIYSTIFDVEKLKHFWKEEELRSLCSQFDNCFKDPGEVEHVVFKSEELEQLTVDNSFGSSPPKIEELKDDAILGSAGSDELIDLHTPDSVGSSKTRRSSKPVAKGLVLPASSQGSTTQGAQNGGVSGVGGHSRAWPQPKNLTNVIVQGHLVGISNILTMMDKRFTALLSQSVKGAY